MRRATNDRRREVADALAGGGCLAPWDEADALLEAAARRTVAIEELVGRRLRGEPLAWITGWTRFCGLRIHVDRGVFCPRPHTEPMARRAASVLPPDGTAVDLCTGSGAVAAVLAGTASKATVLATDIDPLAVACARNNGVNALVGDLDEPLPSSLRGQVDVITAVVPYVPTEELHLLPRDVLANEPHLALDGGPSGTTILDRAAAVAGRWLRPGGTVLLELGGDEARHVAAALRKMGFVGIRVHRDDEGQDRSIEARHLRPSASGVGMMASDRDVVEGPPAPRWSAH